MTDQGETMDEQVKVCAVCGETMDPDRAWWWTSTCAVCSEQCAREVTEYQEDRERSARAAGLEL